jgi:3-hydroxybutyryl-CoA dehydrogenase
MRSVLIYGCGVIGRAVAKTFCRAGIEVTAKVRDRGRTVDLEPGIESVVTLPEIAPDLILEFVPEELSAKKQVFAEIESKYPDQKVVIATGTSGLDLHALSKDLKHPERFLGIHYFMPADISSVVEVMAGPCATRELVDEVAALIVLTGKRPIRLYKPVRGFLLNRLQHAILHEAYYLIENGIASVEDIDESAKNLLGPRMCISGLIRQKDISGLRVHAEAQLAIVPDLHHNNIPNPMLQKMVARGETGLAAGIGFYDWSSSHVGEVRSQLSAQMQRIMDEMSRLDATDQSKLQARPRTVGELLKDDEQH